MREVQVKREFGVRTTEQAKMRHWEDLAEVALEFYECWREYSQTGSKDPDGYIVDDPVIDSGFDQYLVLSLLAHLRVEFPEFAKVKRWPDLLNVNTATPELVSKLRLVGYRRTFEGTCPICEAYETQSAEAMGTMSTREAIDAFSISSRGNTI